MPREATIGPAERLFAVTYRPFQGLRCRRRESGSAIAAVASRLTQDHVNQPVGLVISDPIFRDVRFEPRRVSLAPVAPRSAVRSQDTEVKATAMTEASAPSRPTASLAQLEAFVTAARCRSFTDAAAILGISQPAISSAVKKLEEHLHARLFIRRPWGIELTLVGREIFPHANQAVDSAYAAVREARAGGPGHQNSALAASVD